MNRIGDAAFPYSLFVVGLVVGTERIVQAIVMTPRQETGHVIAAFASGGYSAWDIGEWNLALTYGGNDRFITVAGVFGEVIIDPSGETIWRLYSDEIMIRDGNRYFLHRFSDGQRAEIDSQRADEYRAEVMHSPRRLFR